MPKTLVAELKRLRKEQSLTQEQVADKMHLKRSSYALKEKTGDFDQSELKALSKILGVPTSSLSLATPGEMEDSSMVRNYRDYLVLCSVRVESRQQVMLNLLAELVAAQRQQPIDEVISEINQSIDEISSHMLSNLK